MDGFPSPLGGSSATRQKNCHSCIRAKRRCDRRTPVCSRCVEKKLRCSYTTVRARGRLDNGHHEQQPTNPERPSPCHHVDSFEAALMNTTLYTPSSSAKLSDYSHPIMPMSVDDNLDLSVGPALTDMMGAGYLPTQMPWTDTARWPIAEHLDAPVDEEITIAYQKMAPFCVSLSTHSADPTFFPVKVLLLVTVPLQGPYTRSVP